MGKENVWGSFMDFFGNLNFLSFPVAGTFGEDLKFKENLGFRENLKFGGNLKVWREFEV